jgi:glycosyltransferase involved in cell wall biosynthesis
MKVLHITNSLKTGGAEKLILETLPLYNQRKVEADLLLLDGKNYPFMEQMRRLGGCEMFSLSNGSLYRPAFIFKIIPYFKKYDIIHVHLFPALYWVALAKMLSFTKVRLVFTEHSTSNRRRNNFLLKMADQFIYSFYDKIICISEEVKTVAQQHLGFKDNRFDVIQNGVNLAEIFSETPYTNEEFSFGRDTFMLIQVSSFRYPKDQATLINAMKLLPENVILYLVGEGELLEQNRQLASGLGLESRIHFAGVRMDVPKLLNTTDAVVLSSAYEGLSLSSIEGLASGKPFLATDVPGLRDIVKGAGILFPLKDEAFLAKEVIRLMTDQEYYSEVVSKCLDRSKQYDINVMIESHINLYASMMG